MCTIDLSVLSQHPPQKHSKVISPGRLENESFMLYSNLSGNVLNNGPHDESTYNIYDDELENNILIKVIFRIRIIFMFSI